MTDIYDRAAATVQRVLKPRSEGGKGATITLTRPATDPGTYDPATGAVTAATPVSYTGLAFRESYSLRDIDGTLIKLGDVKLLVAPLQTNGTALPTPNKGDTITFDSTVYGVESCAPWDFAGEVVAFTVQARK